MHAGLCRFFGGVESAMRHFLHTRKAAMFTAAAAADLNLPDHGCTLKRKYLDFAISVT
jgi:hypothetical protein